MNSSLTNTEENRKAKILLPAFPLAGFRFQVSAFLFAFALLAAPVAWAADTTTSAWLGSTNSTWSTATNWTGSVLPSATVSALFDSTFVGANQPVLGAGQVTQGIYLANGATQDVTITGLTSARILTIAGNATLGGQGNASIVLDDTTGTNNNLTIGNLVTTTLSNNTGFYVNNAGTLTLNGTGTLTLNTKTLTLGGTSSSGTTNISQVISSATGAIVVNTSGTVTLSGSNSYGTAGTNYTTLTSGTLNLNNTRAVGLGTFTINGGTIDTTNATAGLSSANNAQVWGGNFTFKGTSNFSLGTGTVDLNAGTRTVTTTANTLTVGGIISNGGLIKEGSGALSLTGNSTYTGGTTLNNGTLNINSAGVASTSGPLGNGGNFTINGGTIDNTSGAAKVVLNVNPITLGNNFAFSTAGGTALNNLTLPGAVTLSANRTITANGAGTLTLSGVIGGVGEVYSLTKEGTGTLALSGANTYTGATTINGGTLSIGNATTFANTSNITLASGGRLDVNVANQTLAKLATSGGGSGVVAGSFLRYSQAQTTGGTGPGTISGTVELNITNANPNYTLDFGDGGKLTNVFAGTVAYTSGITLSGNATIDSANQRFDGTGMTVSASTAGAKTLTLTGSYINPTTSNINGVISDGIGTLNLVKTGVGSWNLSANNTFTGSVTVADGTLKLGSAGALNVANVVTVGGSGTTPVLDVNLTNTIAGLNGGGFTNGTVTNTGGTARTLTLGGSGTYSYGGNITATTPANLALTKSGSGIQNLGGTNTYAGNTLVSAGTLQFAKQVALYNNGAAAAWSNTNINVNSGATMAFNIGGTGEFTKANIITLLGLSTGANGFKTGSIVGLDTTSGDFLYDSVIANPNSGSNVLGLTKLGANKLTLSQANTYTGNTTVTAGTLVIAAGGSISNGSVAVNGGHLNVNGSTGSGAVTVAASATLSGTGTIGGATTISGTHNPGNSPGIQTFSSSLAYTGGASVVNWELSGNTTTVGANPTANFDQIIIGGNLDFTGTTTMTLSFNPAGSSVLWSDTFWSTSKTGASGWLVYQVAGTTTNFSNLSLTTANWLDSGSNAFNTAHPGASFQLTQVGQNIYLDYTAVPEPATWALLAFSLTTVMVLRRRRNS